MDAIAIRRFIATNVSWPLNRFFIPEGGLHPYLHENLRFKVFLIMTAVFVDPFAGATVASLTPDQMAQLRRRMRDLVRHMVC